MSSVRNFYALYQTVSIVDTLPLRLSVDSGQTFSIQSNKYLEKELIVSFSRKRKRSNSVNSTILIDYGYFITSRKPQLPDIVTVSCQLCYAFDRERYLNGASAIGQYVSPNTKIRVKWIPYWQLLSKPFFITRAQETAFFRKPIMVQNTPFSHTTAAPKNYYRTF